MTEIVFPDFFSEDGQNFRPSAIRALSSLINDPAVVSFAGGTPNPATFPSEAIAEVASRVIRERKHVSLQYGPTRGLPRLREFIAGLCGDRRVFVRADEVLVTTGSQQALDLVAHTLVDPGDVVLVELPSYIGGLSSFFGRRAELKGVAQDDEGLIPDSLKRAIREVRAAGKKPKLLYTIPNFQNPSGRLMTQRRRDEIVEVARSEQLLILEDDPYGELVYTDSADTTPMAARDHGGSVIYLGTFSKVLVPGLRCGWVCGVEPLIRQLELAKEAADLCSGMLDQSIVDEYCASGLLPAQVQRVRSFYREKRNTMMGALDEHFEGKATWTRAPGGLFTFVSLPAGRDTGESLTKAIGAGVAYVPGRSFFVDGSGAETMRMTFARETEERIRDGIAILARVLIEREI